MLEDLTKIATYYSILLFFGFMAKHFVSYHLEINGLKDSEEFNYELPYECLYDLSFNDLDKDKMLKGDLGGIQFDNPAKMQHAYMELFQLFDKLDKIN